MHHYTVTTTDQQTFTVTDAHNQTIGVFRVGSGPCTKIGTYHISPDGHFLAAIANDVEEYGGAAQLLVWALPSGTPIPMQDPQTGVIYSLTFEQGGTRIRAYPDHGRGAIVWDVASGQIIENHFQT